MKKILFDFDKTLTNYDTITSFYFFCAKKERKLILISIYMLLKIFSKMRLITIKNEKEIALRLLCPRDIEKFENYCREFAKSVKFNEIYYNVFFNNKNDIVIQSASYLDYLKYIFPQNMIIGTTLKVENGRIRGIQTHPYGRDKLILLKEMGIYNVDEFYFDSKSDEIILQIVERWYKVSNGKIINSNNEHINI